MSFTMSDGYLITPSDGFVFWIDSERLRIALSVMNDSQKEALKKLYLNFVSTMKKKPSFAKWVDMISRALKDIERKVAGDGQNISSAGVPSSLLNYDTGENF